MPSVMPPRVTIMPNYAELCYYADYAAPMQLCRFIMLASRGMPNQRATPTACETIQIELALFITYAAAKLTQRHKSVTC
jgi:hypothetical protein